MKVLSALLVLLVVNRCYSIENRDLYDVVAQGSVTLPRGDEESVQVHLQTPINFYTEKYDSIYVSSNQSRLPTQELRALRSRKIALFLDGKRERKESIKHLSFLLVLLSVLKKIFHHGAIKIESIIE